MRGPNITEQSSFDAQTSEDKAFAEALNELEQQLGERRLQLNRASSDRANHHYSVVFRVGRDPLPDVVS